MSESPRRPPRHARVQQSALPNNRSALAKRYTLRPKSFKISEHSDITRSLTMGSPAPMGGEDVSLDYRSTRARRTSSSVAQGAEKKMLAADAAIPSGYIGAMAAQSLTAEVCVCVCVCVSYMLYISYTYTYMRVCRR
jgi:hypothetical protein